MKTTLHYQVKDFKRFVLENIEKRGYILAAGCEPMMTDMEDMDDPEQVVMEVLVEVRANTDYIDYHYVETTTELPAALSEALSAPATAEVINDESPPIEKPKPDITEEQLEKKREYQRNWAAKKRTDQAHAREVIAQAKAKAKQLPQETDAEPDPPGFLSNLDAQFQREVLGEIEALRKEQGVVAPAPLPFHYEEAEELANLAGA